MKRSLYDFTITPNVPKEVDAMAYYFPHKKRTSLGIQSCAPAFRDPPCMVANYDKDGNLLFTRFIFKDGTYKDEK